MAYYTSMSLSRILIALGILIALAPFLGIPLSMLRWVLPFIGVVVMFIGYTLRAPKKKDSESIPSTEPIIV